MIVEGRDISAPRRERTHTLVVGSGAGGAVVAHTLASAGVDVLVLEEGGHHTARDFTQRENEMMPRLFRASGNQPTHDGLVNVLQGSTYGGSTVINMADCVPTPPEVFAHWKRLVGIEGIDERTLEPSLARVEAMLRVNPIRDDEVNANNRTLLDAARRRGLASGTFRHNRVGCIGSGYCLLGCAYDAKQGAHITYLPKAVAAGARVFTDVRAERIERLGPRRFVVHGVVVERGPRRARVPFVVEAERVVLAAGAVHSPAILWHSGFAKALPQLGKNLSLQPQLGLYARFGDERTLRAWRGIPQSVFVSADDDNTAEHGLGGFRLEPIYGGLGQLALAIGGFGREHKEAMAAALHTAQTLLLVPDRPSGQVTWEHDPEHGFRPRMHYRPQPEWIGRVRAGIARAGELYFESGASRVGAAGEGLPAARDLVTLRRAAERFPVRPGLAQFISAHVQGTCRMSPDAKTGVVDTDHRVHGAGELYVVDASVMPTTASTHTMIPIMAMADRAAHRMLG